MLIISQCTSLLPRSKNTVYVFTFGAKVGVFHFLKLSGFWRIRRVTDKLQDGAFECICKLIMYMYVCVCAKKVTYFSIRMCL